MHHYCFVSELVQRLVFRFKKKYINLSSISHQSAGKVGGGGCQAHSGTGYMYSIRFQKGSQMIESSVSRLIKEETGHGLQSGASIIWLLVIKIIGGSIERKRKKQEAC